jgi:hypothetical protein
MSPSTPAAPDRHVPTSGRVDPADFRSGLHARRSVPVSKIRLWKRHRPSRLRKPATNKIVSPQPQRKGLHGRTILVSLEMREKVVFYPWLDADHIGRTGWMPL